MQSQDRKRKIFEDTSLSKRVKPLNIAPIYIKIKNKQATYYFSTAERAEHFLQNLQAQSVPIEDKALDSSGLGHYATVNLNPLQLDAWLGPNAFRKLESSTPLDYSSVVCEFPEPDITNQAVLIIDETDSRRLVSRIHSFMPDSLISTIIQQLTKETLIQTLLPVHNKNCGLNIYLSNFNTDIVMDILEKFSKDEWNQLLMNELSEHAADILCAAIENQPPSVFGFLVQQLSDELLNKLVIQQTAQGEVFLELLNFTLFPSQMISSLLGRLSAETSNQLVWMRRETLMMNTLIKRCSREAFRAFEEQLTIETKMKLFFEIKFYSSKHY